MKVLIAENYKKQSEIAAEIIADEIKRNPSCCIGTATGSSVVGLYEALTKKYNNGELSFKDVFAINLDEYRGVSGEHHQSFRYFLDDKLFKNIDINMSNTYIGNGTVSAEEAEIEFNDILASHDRDIQILGVGVDGHLGFNEPQSILRGSAHIEKLDNSTIQANSVFFEDEKDVPHYAITMGMSDIMKAKTLLLIISGKKEDVAKKLLMDDIIDSMCPVTFLKMHRNAIVIIDENIAKNIGFEGK